MLTATIDQQSNLNVIENNTKSKGTKTGEKATLQRCHWISEGNTLKQASFTGDVYQDIHGKWLKHPGGFSRVNDSDIHH